MCDAGVGEEALEVVLRHRGEVAIEQRQHCEEHEDANHFRADCGDCEEDVEHTDENDESGGFAAHAEERGDGCRCALIYVGNPKLERRGCNFEAERDEHEHDAKQERMFISHERSAVGESGDERGLHIDKTGLAGESENPGDSIHKESGAERAEDEVFHAGFERLLMAAHVGDEDVESDRDEFQRDKDEHEIHRRSHEHEPGADENRETVKLAGPPPFLGARDEFCEHAAIFQRHDEHNGGRGESDAFEEHRCRVIGIEIPHSAAAEDVVRRTLDGEKGEADQRE